MIKDTLSTELLLQIIHHLSPSDIQQGLLICKKWYPTFLYALYHQIKVKSSSQLDLLFPSLISNGHYIKTFSIDKPTTIPPPQQQQILFQKLPDLCPNLQVLNFDDPATWKSFGFHPNMSQWNLIQLPVLVSLGTSLPFLHTFGQSLSSLSLQTGMLIDISTRYRILSIFSFTPQLKELFIVQQADTFPTTLCLTLQDIELFHTTLPLLESLSIVGDRIEMSIIKDDNHAKLIPTTIEPAPLLFKLHWNTSLAPVTWLLYMAHKYPRLKNLTLAIQEDPVNISINPEHDCYRQLLHHCRHLETISLSSPVITDWLNPDFFHALPPSVRKIRPIPNRQNQIRFDSELFLAAGEASEFISLIEIDQWRLNMTIDSTLHLVSHFSQLRYLQIKYDSYHKEYNLNRILNTCPGLDHLILEWGALLIADDGGGGVSWFKERKHMLKSFQLTFIAFDPNLFQYLSSRCPSLSTLILTKCKQRCQAENVVTHTVIQIEMPCHAFELILIDGVRLDYSFAGIYVHGLSSYIRLARIEKKKEKMNWIRHVGYEYQTRSPLLQSLDAEQVESTESYFLQRQQSAYTQQQNELNDPGLKQLNVEFGYIQVQCKSLNRFVLDGNISH
ncbi:hypothetical protein BD770DRAFT_376569 [Pilaira anomala]|nr:hypothetical protein BD770DRAFT_376569 [Pilaira anomala]